ncbi:hypothetical protein DSCW_18760 [Desulfosarcina widdelii]|uniref:Peptidase C39-like domain-containing protein n=1 Tax=Desulfosarcina widdelii TaxID=947919 RepID=A0A5K7Z2H0_9BACT|nr:PA2778 family cysteine peptidase [Desulfosarcina widdelii]BBO74459.1 hypothetical protein DSCW_18760 [Desulfosarcina widdelii]
MRLLVVAVLAVVLSGCAGRTGIGWPRPEGRLPDPYLIAEIPFYPQKVHQCGPAALAMALNWSGVSVSPQDLSVEVFTPSRKGSLQSAMIAAVRRHGRIACLLAEPADLIDEVAAGHPVVVLQNLGLSWIPLWHYAVVVGWDAAAGDVILHSGTTPFKPTAFSTFERTWARSGFWGMLVLPPSRLPATAKETDYLAAVSHLERMGRWKIALPAYRTALGRWPDSLAATVGIGVCLYRSGDLASAEAHFRAAIEQFPREGVLFNNLAQVLLEQGRRDEALQAAGQAIECGGPLKAHFEQTLEEIRNR